MPKLSIIKDRNTITINLNEDIKSKLGIEFSDIFYFADEPGGNHKLVYCDLETAKSVKILKEIMDEDSEVLKALADK